MGPRGRDPRRRPGPQRIARRRGGQGGLRCPHRPGMGDRRRPRHPRAADDRTRRRGRDVCVPGDPHVPGREDLPRRGRGPGRRQAVRLRGRGTPHRSRRAPLHGGRNDRRRGRCHRDRRLDRPGGGRRRPARPAPALRGPRADPPLGRRGPPPQGPHQRRHPRGLRQGTEVRGRGYRAGPHRAHVPR